MTTVGVHGGGATVRKPATASAEAKGPVLSIKQHNLVREALPVVEECASKICWKYDLFGRPERRHIHNGGVGDCVGYSDLCTIGKLALYESVPRFQPGRNRTFKRYAHYRVLGAMMDEVIATTVQARVDREMLRAFAYYMADHNDDFDIMRHEKPEMQRRVDAMCGNAAAVMFVAGAEEARVEAERDLVADTEETALAIEGLRALIGDLSEEERQFLALLFAHGFDHHKVGEIIGVARETVCRRLARLCADLKRLLKTLDITHVPPRTQLPGLRPLLSEPDDVEAEPGEEEPTGAHEPSDTARAGTGKGLGKKR